MALCNREHYRNYMKRVSRNIYIGVNIYAFACYLMSLICNVKLIPLVFKGHIFLLILTFIFTLGLRLLYKCSGFFRDYVDYTESTRDRKTVNTRVEKIEKIERIVRESEDITIKENEPQIKEEETVGTEEGTVGTGKESVGTEEAPVVKEVEDGTLEKTLLYKPSSASDDPLMKQLLKINERDN